MRRRWLPRLGRDTVWGRFRRRVRGTMRRTGDAANADPGCAPDLGEGIGVALLVIVAVTLLVFVGLPVIVAIVDLVVLLLLLLGGVVARVLFRRPWIVEASADDGTRLTWRVVGWRASGERCAEMGRSLEAGIVPPDAVQSSPPATDQ